MLFKLPQRLPMSKLLRGLALAFLVIGFMFATEAAATGRYVLETGLCFVLEIAFVWLNLRHSAELRSTGHRQVDQPNAVQPLHQSTGDGFAVRIEVRNAVAANDGGRPPATATQGRSPTRIHR